MAHLKKWFWFGCGSVGVGTVLLFLLGSGWLGFRLFQLEWRPQGQTDLVMAEVSLPFHNRTDLSKKTGSLPFMAGVVIDIDGDLSDEIFLGGGRGQADALFTYDPDKNAFIDIALGHDLTKLSGDATLGGASIDVDRNGYSDLIIARESGLWLYLNNGYRLTGGKIDITLNETSTPLSIALGDLNADGLTDLYVSGYIRNDLVDGQTNFSDTYGGFSHLLLGTGDGTTWRDATEDYGLDSQHNRFTAVFADLDNDGDPDLTIAQDTGVVETWRNDGQPPLTPLPNPSQKSYPMGIAAGDLSGNGFVDLYFSNVGHTMPSALLRGDLPEEVAFNPLYMLFENSGGAVFSDTAKPRKAARIGFGWGTVAADMNLDGWDDLIIAQNYAKFGPPAIIHRYTGKIMQNNQGETFSPVEKRVGVQNRLFAISPLIGDFNGDSLPDLVWANLNGPSKAFLNQTENRNVLTILMDDTADVLSTRIEVITPDRTIYRQVIASQGLSSDQTHKLMIGLGDSSQVQSVTIVQPGRERAVFDDWQIDTPLDLRTERSE